AFFATVSFFAVVFLAAGAFFAVVFLVVAAVFLAAFGSFLSSAMWRFFCISDNGLSKERLIYLDHQVFTGDKNSELYVLSKNK
ncbi:hypothetical protein N9L60_05760, partial [Flavobacteriales bacterium]|nr:hypothetical protein [Flavobacteriales bacterium]